jgi:hypothetical protein
MNDLAEKENKTKETNIVSIILNASFMDDLAEKQKQS